MSGFAGYQNEIYMAGLGDVVPDLPTDLTRLGQRVFFSAGPCCLRTPW